MPSISDLQAAYLAATRRSSNSGYGTAVAPSGGQVFVSCALDANAVYEVTVIAGYGATPDALDNIEIACAGIPDTRLLVSPVANAVGSCTLRIAVGSSPVSVVVRAKNASAAGAVFRGSIIANPVG